MVLKLIANHSKRLGLPGYRQGGVWHPGRGPPSPGQRVGRAGASRRGIARPGAEFRLWGLECSRESHQRGES